MARKKNTAWNIWTLHRLDIEHAIDRLGYGPRCFSTEDLEDIAYRFKKGLECACMAWDEWLDDAVLFVAEDKGLSPVLRILHSPDLHIFAEKSCPITTRYFLHESHAAGFQTGKESYRI